MLFLKIFLADIWSHTPSINAVFPFFVGIVVSVLSPPVQYTFTLLSYSPSCQMSAWNNLSSSICWFPQHLPEAVAVPAFWFLECRDTSPEGLQAVDRWVCSYINIFMN